MHMFATTLAVAISTLALAACSAENPPPDQQPPAPSVAQAAPETASPANTNVLTSAGYGALRIGMSQQDIDRAYGPIPDTSHQVSDECLYYHPPQAPEGLLVMVQDGQLTRITLRQPADIKTDKGFGVGDDPAAIRAAYGDQGRWGLHAYESAPAGYFIVWSDKVRNSDDYVEDPAARGVVYEVGGEGRVKLVHAGGPSIQLVEGCA